MQFFNIRYLFSQRFYMRTRHHKYFYRTRTKEGHFLRDRDGFAQVIRFLTPELRAALDMLGDELKRTICEIRLRAGRPAVLVLEDGSTLFFYPNGRVSRIYGGGVCVLSCAELADCFNRLCGYSVHSNSSSIANGFISLEGGHRAGICGTAVCSDSGKITAVRDISSINIRIAGEFIGTADRLYESLFAGGTQSVIIGGPPLSGKTTILRDLARQLSGASRGVYRRVAVVDERGEIAASYRGQPQMDIGFCDVLSGYPKAEGIMIALRTLSPQVIICDEIGGMREVEAVCEGMNSGVDFVLSAHMGHRRELFMRTPLRHLVQSGAFSNLVMLRGRSPCDTEGIYGIKELSDEICGSGGADSRVSAFGSVFFPLSDDASQTA